MALWFNTSFIKISWNNPNVVVFSLSQFLETLSLSQWIEEVQIDYTVHLKNDTDPDSLKQIHLYRVLWPLEEKALDSSDTVQQWIWLASVRLLTGQMIEIDLIWHTTSWFRLTFICQLFKVELNYKELYLILSMYCN